MKIEFKLLRAKKLTPDGFPLVVEISHRGKRKQKTVCFCQENHFTEAGKMVTSKHPDFDLLAPLIMDLKIKAKKIKLSGIDDVNQAMQELFKIEKTDVDFLKFADDLISEMKVLMDRYEKQKDLISRNKISGNIKVYQNVILRFKELKKSCLISEINYDVLMRFRNYHLGIGNNKSTVHLYLRTLRAIYNKCLMKYELPDKKPFTGVFSGLKTKSFVSKKKYISKESIFLLENYFVPGASQKYIDLWLLQFYFGGCDLIDLYYLKKINIRKGRIYFERGKTETGLLIDLKIHPKAAAILEKFKNDSEYIIDGRKDVDGYATYRRRYTKALIKAQDDLGIQVMPLGGNLGVKVARHTFANIAKNLMLDPDLIRELMGHERDAVDNYYKDRFSEKVRDEALFKIID
jgi:hypothetical protein